MSRPSVEHRLYAVPRAGGKAGDYEDASALRADEWPVCAAVADGATESVFARQWAATLVNGLVAVEAMTEQAFRAVVEQGQREWQASVAGGDAERPWYVTAKAAEGAYATALGLSLHPDGTWRAVSVGDCCLFHWREGTLRQSWPMDASEAFTNRPALLPSRPGAAVPAPSTVSGTWAGGDTFVLMTDAVAAWLLECRARAEDIADVWALDQTSFQDRIETARESGALRNDDATLLLLDLTAMPEANGDSPE